VAKSRRNTESAPKTRAMIAETMRDRRRVNEVLAETGEPVYN